MVLECDCCNKRYCIKRLGMPAMVYKYMRRANVLWCCSPCVPAVKETVSRQSNKNINVPAMQMDVDEIISSVKTLITLARASVL